VGLVIFGVFLWLSYRASKDPVPVGAERVEG